MHGAFAVCFAAETLTRDTRVRNDDDNSVVLFFRSQFLFFVFVSRWVCVQHNGFRFLGGVCVCASVREGSKKQKHVFRAHNHAHIQTGQHAVTRIRSLVLERNGCCHPVRSCSSVLSVTYTHAHYETNKQHTRASGEKAPIMSG